MLKRLLFLSCGFLLMTSNAFAQIEVVNFDSPMFGVGEFTSPATSYTVSNFDAGMDTKLVVSFAMEVTSPNFSVTFGGAQLTEIETSSDASGGSHSGIFFLDSANGVRNIVVNTGSGEANGAGVFIQALSGAETGFETSGTLGNGQAVFGDLTGTLTGISRDAHITSMFIDQNRDFADQTVTGLTEVSVFGGGELDQIGSAIAQAANGTGTGGDITVTFNDLGDEDSAFNNRSNASYASFAVEGGPLVLIGDVNTDDIVNFLDIAPFIGVLSMPGAFQPEADINQDGVVNFLDIAPFIGALANAG